MKTKIIIFLFCVAVYLMMSCGKKDDKCLYDGDRNGVSLPDECYDCAWYAPDSAFFSSTDYNTVEQLRNCFVCHKKTLTEHSGDTIKLAGWIYWGDSESGEWVPAYMSGITTGDVYFTDREDHLGEQKLFKVYLNEEWYARFNENKEELLREKWYVTGILRREFIDLSDVCCHLSPTLTIIDVDLINFVEP